MGRRGIIFLGVAALLSGCSKGGTPEDQPPIPLATMAERDAVKLEGAGDQPLTGYTNDKYGFTIMVPPGWGDYRTDVTADGASFTNPAFGSVLRVQGDAGNTLENVQEDLPGGTMSKTEYRGIRADADDHQTAYRAIKTAQGTTIARLRYPARHAAALMPVAKAVLDSLVVKR
ncbi:hypothetical protein [Sphingobium boeckii]|uniref:Lipoprotein n=1 Tax=Sphingobium boeckii TaxID=1082345 RepID=A0A7W9AGH8_9SPHN|nr:hypothetical protein [Sphingobium boeckii]MBB5685283.1 hypothetical protein [Sphingobium boeckii]